MQELCTIVCSTGRKKEARKTLVEGESNVILGPPNAKGYWGSWRGTKVPEYKADHLPPFWVEINVWS